MHTITTQQHIKKSICRVSRPILRLISHFLCTACSIVPIDDSKGIPESRHTCVCVCVCVCNSIYLSMCLIVCLSVYQSHGLMPTNERLFFP